MASLLNRIGVALGLGQPAAASAPPCTPPRACLFVVLQARVRGRRQLPCARSCTNWAGSRCKKVGGHQCSRDTTAIDGGALECGARTDATRIDPIDQRLARAIRRSWREECWGAQLSVDELMQHGLCRHAKWQFSKDLSSEEEDGPRPSWHCRQSSGKRSLYSATEQPHKHLSMVCTLIYCIEREPRIR